MLTFADIQDAGKTTGFTVHTQFDLESSEKLFAITGPKNLEWKYPKANGTNAPPSDLTAEHVEAVKQKAKGKWRSGFKNDVQKKVVKEIKPLEKLYQAIIAKVKEPDQRKREAAELKNKTAMGVVISDVIATGRAINTYRTSKKEFRAAQEKRLSAQKSDDPKVKKVQKEVKALTEQLKSDTDKLEAMTKGNPADHITKLLAIQKLPGELDIEGDAASHGRLDNAYGVVGQGNSLVGAIGRIVSA